MVWLKNYQNNIYTTSSLAATSLCFNRSKKWVINTRPGDLGSKTAKQLYNSYVLWPFWGQPVHGPGPPVTDATHNFDRFYMKAETIKLYWNRPDFALDDHVWKQHVVVLSPSGGLWMRQHKHGGCLWWCEPYNIKSLLPCITLVAPMDYLLCVSVSLCVSVFWR